ncbi:hypothetical protein LDC_0716 [sediment metagenome]|uniref:Uncharacterized protein n=1 Tax=sediment metagenome TaxID=749907 RepID=D9PGR9_9ZZZZ
MRRVKCYSAGSLEELYLDVVPPGNSDIYLAFFDYNTMAAVIIYNLAPIDV